MATKTERKKKLAWHKKVRPLTKLDRLEELKVLVDLCFFLMDEPDLKEVANRTGLSLATLYRLQKHEFTLAVQTGTLIALAGAVGCEIELTERKVRVRLVD